MFYLAKNDFKPIEVKNKYERNANYEFMPKLSAGSIYLYSYLINHNESQNFV